MDTPDWFQGIPVAFTVCDTEGVILDLNEAACRTFEKYGGTALVGKNILDCHSQATRQRVEGMLKKPARNVYVIEQDGVEKLVCQVPWRKDGEFAGYVEMSMLLPPEMPHFIRL